MFDIPSLNISRRENLGADEFFSFFFFDKINHPRFDCYRFFHLVRASFLYSFAACFSVKSTLKKFGPFPQNPSKIQ